MSWSCWQSLVDVEIRPSLQPGLAVSYMGGKKVEVESGEVHQGKSQQDLAGGRAGCYYGIGLVSSAQLSSASRCVKAGQCVEFPSEPCRSVEIPCRTCGPFVSGATTSRHPRYSLT